MANNNRRFGGWFGSAGFGGAGGGAAGGGGGLLSGGKLIFLGFIGLIIGGGFLFTGGNPFPKNQLTKPAPGTYEIDEESLKELEDGKRNLQLKTIRFKECGGTTAITMMLDTTGSMLQPNTKINGLKEAVITFTSGLSDDSVIGIERFNQYIGVSEEVPVSLYSDVKNIIPQRIAAINPAGGTNTIQALQSAKDTLINAQAAFPDRKFSLIFVSDGLPNIPGGIDLGPLADPRLQTPNPIEEIKNLDVTIYSIGIFGPGDASGLKLMQDIASRPDTFYNSPTGAELQAIYKEISTKICQSAKINSQ